VTVRIFARRRYQAPLAGAWSGAAADDRRRHFYERARPKAPRGRSVQELYWRSGNVANQRIGLPVAIGVQNVGNHADILKHRERQCADTTGTVPVLWAGHFQR